MIAIQKGDFLQIKSEGKRMLVEVSKVQDNGWIAGWKINKHGDKIEHETKEAIVQHLIVFRLANVQKRLTMNLHYGELE